MKLFLTWSGDMSQELGEIFRKVIPSMLQTVQPYFTPSDTEKGTRWYSEISKHLEASEFGLIILTKAGLTSSWIMFEAGALSKNVDKSRICPVLFGISDLDVQEPLAQFQMTKYNKNDIFNLIKSINHCCGEYELGEKVLDQVFEKWWPDLEKGIDEVMARYKDHKVTQVRKDRELIEEILSIVRSSYSKKDNLTEDQKASISDLQTTISGILLAIASLKRHIAENEGKIGSLRDILDSGKVQDVNQESDYRRQLEYYITRNRNLQQSLEAHIQEAYHNQGILASLLNVNH
jgi:hypothetical protein